VQKLEPVKQGLYDGLCGIYCLVNALRHTWGRLAGPDDTDALRYLLEAADRIRLFSVSRVVNGFEAHELCDVFNEFARAHDFAWTATSLQSEAEVSSDWSFTERTKQVFSAGGFVIAGVDSGMHWVLARKYDQNKKVILVDDSDPSGGCHAHIRGSQAGRYGVILLPKKLEG
jgi:hypothetical protein